ncbi:MAG: hypothetical protein AB8G18_12075 [Gammaproteobacteria bacterium]
MNGGASVAGLRLAVLSVLVTFLCTAHSCLADDTAIATEQMVSGEALPATVAPAADSTAQSTAAEPTANAQAIEQASYRPELLGNLSSRRLNEASGLALSTRSRDIAWAHNDSGHGPYLFAFTLEGEDRGRFYLEKALSSDWEDMDAFRWQNQSWLLIADTGDNRSVKPYYTLYLAAEPADLTRKKPGLRLLRKGQRARITYPTGPADTEAVAVDVAEERVYLITKRKRPVEVFSVPLDVFKDGDTKHEARFETYMYPLPTPTLQDLLQNPNLGLAFGQPNALDISTDSSFAIVQTYNSSYRFDRSAKQTWAEAFAAAPKRIEVPIMKQSEAVAIGWDNQALYYTSEGKYPPIYRLEPVPPEPVQ